MKPGIILLLLLTIFSGCKRKERIKPKISPITESVYASGIVKTEDQYQVFAEVSGIIQKRLVSGGDTVVKDQPIFIIENRTSELNTENSKLALEISRERLKKINDLERNVETNKKSFLHDSLMMKRYKSLWENNATTKINWEESKLAFQNSKARYLSSLNELDLERANLQLDKKQAENNLKINKEIEGNYTIRSKVDGMVYDVIPEEGELVSPQTILAVIGKLNNFLIEVQVDEYDIIKVKTGQKIFITMESYQGKVFTGIVTKIYPFMNKQSTTFTVEGVFTEPPSELYPNLTLEANILSRTKNKALTIPREYLIDESFVLVEPDKKVKVKTGLKNYESVEILSGLNPDQYIYKP